MREVVTGSWPLPRVYRRCGFAGTWGEYRDFRRVAIKCCAVFAVATPAGSGYFIGENAVDSLRRYMEDHRGRSGRYRWEAAQQRVRCSGSLPVPEVARLLDVDRSTVRYLPNFGVERQKKDGVLLFNRTHVETLADSKATKKGYTLISDAAQSSAAQPSTGMDTILPTRCMVDGRWPVC